MSFICGICHKSTGSLYSKLIVEIREKKKSVNDDNIATFSPPSSSSSSSNTIEYLEEKSKMAHIECCSHEQIKQILLSQAEDQIRFYKDIIDLIKEEKGKDGKSFLNKINNFEQKYCSFDEIRQGTSIDRDVFTYALIAELKRKTQIE
jgi:transcription elongation factor Elf1